MTLNLASNPLWLIDEGVLSMVKWQQAHHSGLGFTTLLLHICIAFLCLSGFGDAEHVHISHAVYTHFQLNSILMKYNGEVKLF